MSDEDVEMGDYDGGGGDTFAETEYSSWFERLKASAGGICIGALLMFGSQIMLFWNEGRNVARIKDLNESEKNFQQLNSIEAVDSQFNSKLVHVNGKTSVAGNLSDIDFGISEPAIRMRRDVETYQWVETTSTTTRKKTGGGKFD